MIKTLQCIVAAAGALLAPATALAQGRVQPIELPPSLPALAPAEATPVAQPIQPTPDTDSVDIANPEAASTETVDAPAPVNTDPADAAAAAMAAEIAERQRTAALNATLARSAKEQLRAAEDARNAAARQAEAGYQAELDARAAAIAESDKRHAAEMAEWRRRVAACQSGDKKQCAQ